MTPRLSATKTKLLYRYAVILVPLDLIEPKNMYVLSKALYINHSLMCQRVLKVCKLYENNL